MLFLNIRTPKQRYAKFEERTGFRAYGKFSGKVIADCPVCRINKAAPVTPIMGPLPMDRLEPFVRPFTYTGLDYFGPIAVTIGRRQERGGWRSSLA